MITSGQLTTRQAEPRPTLVTVGTGKTGAASRSASRRAASRSASARARASRRSTGTTRPRGRPRCAASARPTSPTTRTSRCPARSGRSARSPSSPSAAACGGWCCSPAAARRRPSAPSRRCSEAGAEWTIVRCSLVQPELQRGLPARSGARRRGRAARRRRARAVRRRRRHRRRRRRRADRGRPRGQIYELTGPRLLTFAEAVGGDRRGDRPRDPLRPGLVEEYTAALAEQGVPADVRLAADLPVQRGARRPQRPPGRRRAARARPRAARLPRLRARRRRDRRLGSAVASASRRCMTKEKGAG